VSSAVSLEWIPLLSRSKTRFKTEF